MRGATKERDGERAAGGRDEGDFTEGGGERGEEFLGILLRRGETGCEMGCEILEMIRQQ